ncbi:MAG TPA: hypothetical protein P5550_10165 [Bacteroidales bacterium]|nr:hypothetical protein [Bacteroidales bacterium]HRZ77105.1 hypothetical protein [Bacteroidales bacterium]
MKRTASLILLLALMGACEKPLDMKMVKYFITDSDAGFTVTYTNEKGEKQAPLPVVTASQDEEWEMEFMAEAGTIVYLSVLDTVPESFTRVMIYVDGKVYKQGVRNEDPTKPVVVSGTIPY